MSEHGTLLLDASSPLVLCSTFATNARSAWTTDFSPPLAFAGVVMLTMFAAMSFEPRMLWDRLEDLSATPANPTTPPET
jgi:uncharacterized paraquat-inducible protein A